MAKQKTEDNILINAAKAVGTVAGKIASVIGVAPEKPSAAKHAIGKGKLQKKHKSRLPRRQKKFQQKAAARQSAAQQPTL